MLFQQVQENSCFCLGEGPFVYIVCVSATISELSEAKRNTQEYGGILATSRTFMIHWSQGGSCLLTQPGFPSARPRSSSLLCSGAKLGDREGLELFCFVHFSQSRSSQVSSLANQASPLPRPSSQPDPFVVLQCPVIEALHWGCI